MKYDESGEESFSNMIRLENLQVYLQKEVRLRAQGGFAKVVFQDAPPVG